MSRPIEDSARGRARGTWRSRGRGGQSQSQPSRGSSVDSGQWRSGQSRGSLISNTSTDTGSGTISNRRQMELIPSISRSSGLDKDGDSLKNYKVQEEYRSFIEEKVKKVLKRHENLELETEDQKKHRIEEQENVLILLRKLREGISSSGRNDSFSIEVYERSLYLSILFASPKHTTAIIPALLNDLYKKSPTSKSLSPKSAPDLQYHRHISHLVSLLYQLASRYPSQSLYFQQLTTIPNDWMPEPTRTWLQAVTRSLRSGNYYQFGIMTQNERVSQLLEATDDTLHGDLARRALLVAIEALRSKAQETIWSIIRSAYRELWLEESYDTPQWLCRSLCINEASGLNQWLNRLATSSQIRQKEGSEERWIVSKLR